MRLLYSRPNLFSDRNAGRICGGAASIVTPTLADPDAPIELSDDEIRERMSGNLCRCGAYPNIVAAVREIQPIRLNDCPKVSNDETI